MTEKLNRVLALVLTIVALMTGQRAWAESSWEVTNNYGNSNTFTIKRSETGYVQKVLYRTISLSAYAGQHFTAKNGELEFLANEDEKTVTVSELTPTGAYLYYKDGTTVKYGFEVTDRAGFRLAYAERKKTWGTSVPTSGIFDEKSVTVNGGEITVTDDNYSQAYHTVSLDSYFSAAAAQGYLATAGVQLRMTLNFQAKEKDDGYQHVQILVNQTSNHDEGSGNNNPGTINYSSYMACFCHEGGTKNTNYSNYVFPVTSKGDLCGNVGKVWSSINSTNNVGELREQKFNTNCRASDGTLIIADVNASGVISSVSGLKNLGIRFDASGDNEDTWYAKNTVAKIQAIDYTYPTRIAITANPGRHAKGNTFYVSVAFSEIVTSTNATLSTSWGSMNLEAGSGTNVLTFKGTIKSDAANALNVTSRGGNIYDLSGRTFIGDYALNEDNLATLDGDFAYAIGDFHAGSKANEYLIRTRDDLRGLAGYVNGGNNCSGLTFLQVTDIVFPHTTNWNSSSSTEINYTAIGTEDHPFQGTFDGNNNTISGIRIYRGGNSNSDKCQALFGYVGSSGTVKRVTLSDARITGYNGAGGIAGEASSATIEDCTVGADVCIHAVQSNTNYHGGIVGYNQGGPARSCISRATLTVANSSGCKDFGGIAGLNSDIITDCIADGAVIPEVQGRGAIVGYHTANGNKLTRNYYRACKVAGVVNATYVGVSTSTATCDVNGARALYPITLGTNVTIDRTPATDPLPGTDNYTYANGADIAGVPYAYEGAAVALNYSSEVSTGYHLVYSTTAGTISGSTLTMPAEGVTVSATVPANSYTVRFYKNDGGEDCTDQSFTYDAAQNLSANTFTREDYVFNGWNTQADGNGTSYTNGQSVSNLTATHGSVFTLYAQWRQVAGSCGDNARWNYDDNGTLTITGSGAMSDYGANNFPWEDYKSYITTVSIGDDITEINGVAFKGCTNLATVTGGSGLTSVYYAAFALTPWCNATEASTTVVYLGHVAFSGRGVSGDVIIDDGTVSIADYAFSFNDAITSVTIPASVTSIGNSAFNDCTTLTTVNVLGTTPPTLGSGVFFLTSKNFTLARTFNVRSAAYKTTGQWADINNKENYYSVYTGTTLRVVSTLTLPDGVTAGVADGEKVTILGTDYYAEGADVTLSGLGTEHTDGGVTFRSRATVTYNTDQTLTANAAPSTGQATFTMPAADATVTAEECLYAVKYIDADGTEQTCYNPTAIRSGSGQTLGTNKNDEAWYVVLPGEVTAGGSLTFNDKAVHLILCDGATLTASAAAIGIRCSLGSLTIYTQSGGTGSLTARSTQNNYGIDVNGNVTIYGGIVSATGGSYGIYSSGNITLGWTNPTDHIYASSYRGTVVVKDGQTLTDGSAAYSGTVTASDINGKTLRPDLWGWASGNDGSTVAKAFTITTTGGLDQLATLVNSGNGYENKFFKLGDDITYSHKADNEEGADTENNFTAIGVYIQEIYKCFRGTFDGQGHTISGIRIYKGGTDENDKYQGLFGAIDRFDATIKNVILADARITGRYYVGGIVGTLEAGTVENCRVGSDVTIHAVADGASDHGGVVGFCRQDGTIRGCVSSATLTVADGLTNNSYYGGIVGALDGNMSDCLALGAIVPVVNRNGAIAGSAYIQDNGFYTNNYHYDCTVGGNAAPSNANDVRAYAVSAGTDVTLAPAGNAAQTYDYNGIQRYGDALYYNGVIYALEDANVSLTLGNTVTPAESFDGYAASAGTLSGSANPYTLTMSAGDVTVNVKRVPALTVSDFTTTTADVSWTPCYGVTGYTLQLASDNQFTNPGSLIAEHSVNDTKYTFTGLTPKETYYVRVKGDGRWSDIVEFQTADGGTCGANSNDDNVAWTYNSTTQTLTISGTGAMANYSGGDQPWKDYQSTITSVVIGSGVTSIGNNAFKGCTSLTSVTVYAPSCTLGDDALNGCTNLANIYVFSDKVNIYKNKTNWSNYESKITAIPTVQEGRCGGVSGHESDVRWMLTGTSPNYTLTIMKVGNTGAMADYTSAGYQPWKGYRSSITSVVIGDGVTNIGNDAFEDCTNLTTVTIPTSVTSIGDRAFYQCTNLTTGTIPASVTSIGYRAFFECKGLTSITFPASGTSIGNEAFMGCDNLESVTFPVGSQLTSIGDFAFGGTMNNSKLTSVIIPVASLDTYGENAFANNPTELKIYVPAASLETYKTNWSAYEDNFVGLYNVEFDALALPDGVTGVATPSMAADGESVTLSFNGVPAGKVPDLSITNVVEIKDNGDGTFSFLMPSSNVTVNCGSDLKDDIKMFTATVPNQTKSAYSTVYNSDRTYAYIYNKFDEANSPASFGISVGETVTDGNTTLMLGTDYTFGNVYYSNMTGMNEPAYVGDECVVEIKGIGNYAGILYAPFKIIISNAPGTWGDDHELTWNFANGTLSITLTDPANGNKSMKSAANNNSYPWYDFASYITSISIGEGVTTIAASAFAGNGNVNPYSSMKSVTLPSTLETIGENAFAFSGLTSVDIPASVTTIGHAAFNECDKLATIIVLPVTPPTIGDNDLGSFGSNVSGSKNVYFRNPAYMGNDGWRAVVNPNGYHLGFALVDNGENDIAAIAQAGGSPNIMLYGRTLYRDGDWNTLCLPFEIGDDQIIVNSSKPLYGATIMCFDSNVWYDAEGNVHYNYEDGYHRSGEVENSNLHLYFNRQYEINAGYPYIVKWGTKDSHPATDIVNPVFQGVTVTNTTPIDVTTDEGSGNVTFRGTYSAIDYAADNHSILFLGTESRLYYPKAGAHIGAFRAYFELGNGITVGEANSSVRGFNLEFSEEGTPTGVGHTEITEITERADAEGWYTLDGVKLDKKPTKKGLYIYGGRKVVVK